MSVQFKLYRPTPGEEVGGHGACSRSDTYKVVNGKSFFYLLLVFLRFVLFIVAKLYRIALFFPTGPFLFPQKNVKILSADSKNQSQRQFCCMATVYGDNPAHSRSESMT